MNDDFSHGKKQVDISAILYLTTVNSRFQHALLYNRIVVLRTPDPAGWTVWHTTNDSTDAKDNLEIDIFGRFFP